MADEHDATTAPTDELLHLGRRVLSGAKPGEQVEVLLGRSTSTSVKVFGGEVESLTSATSNGAGVRVIRDGRQGFAHCGSLDPDVLSETLDAMGLGENTALFMNDAKRFLKDGGVFLPSRLDCYAALASPAPYRERGQMAYATGRRIVEMESVK